MSFPRYEKYKSSGVEWLGDVPAGWEVKRLRFVAILNPSKSELAEFDRDTEVSFLPMEAISESGSLNLERARPLCEVETGYTYFRDGDVTIAKITPCFENGKGAVMQDLRGGVGFGTTELIVIRPLFNQTTSDYLHLLFTSAPFRKLGEATMYGAGGQKRVPDDFVRNFAIAFPPLPEQLTIATFLDRETAKIDALIAEQKRLIALLAEKRQAVISHAVTKGLNPDAPMKDSGVEWLGDVPEHWGMIPLSFIVSTRKGIAFKSDDFSDCGIRVVKASDIKNLTIRSSEVFLSEEFLVQYPKAVLNEGDIILSTVGSTPDVKNSAVGQIGVVPRELNGSLLNQNTVVFNPKNNSIENDFLAFVLQTTGYRDHLDLHAHGTANQASLSISDMTRFIAPLPSMAEQKEIAKNISAALEIIGWLESNIESAQSLLRERRAALISAAVTGKIDVRGLAAAQT